MMVRLVMHNEKFPYQELQDSKERLKIRERI